MKIKQFETGKTPFDISEWNDEVKAFIKPLNGFERLILNDLFLTFYDKNREPDDRFDAAFRAALLALVDENDAPLFSESDRDAVRAGSFLPFWRLFSTALNFKSGESLESFKKN
jgi:hypothetical protein